MSLIRTVGIGSVQGHRARREMQVGNLQSSRACFSTTRSRLTASSMELRLINRLFRGWFGEPVSVSFADEGDFFSLHSGIDDELRLARRPVRAATSPCTKDAQCKFDICRRNVVSRGHGPKTEAGEGK